MYKGARVAVVMAAVVSGSGIAADAQTRRPPAASTATAEERNQAEAYYQFMLGRELLEQEQIDAAIAAYRRAAELDPKAAEIPAELAELYATQNRAKDAISSADAALQLDPENAQGHWVLGTLYSALADADGNTEQARTDYARKAAGHLERSRRDRLFNPGLEFRLGRLYVTLDEYEKAIAPLERYIEQDGGAPEAVLMLAQAYIGVDRRADAVRVLEESVGGQSRFVRGQLALAELYEQDDRWADAARLYGRVLQQGRGSADLRERHAAAMLNAGDAAGAKDALRTLTTERPSDAGIWYMLSQAELRANDLPAAEAAAQRVAELDPSDIRAPLALARIFERQRRPAKVVDALTTAIATAQKRNTPGRQLANLYVPLGFAHMQLGRYDQAVGVFEQAKSAAPNDPLLETYVIQALVEGRRFAQAAERARDARSRFPGDLRIIRLEARALQESGQAERGIALLKDTVQQHAKDPDAHLALAELYADAERFGEAEAVLKAGAAAFSGEAAFTYQLGAVLEQQERHDEAEKAFRQVLARDPLHAPTLNYLGYMLADRGVRLDESIELIQRALQVDPDNGSYLDSLGWAYFKQNKLDLAAEHLRKAGEQLQTNSVVQDHLGEVLSRLAQYDEAIAAWERALKGDGEAIDRGGIERKIKAARERGARRPSR